MARFIVKAIGFVWLIESVLLFSGSWQESYIPSGGIDLNVAAWPVYPNSLAQDGKTPPGTAGFHANGKTGVGDIEPSGMKFVLESNFSQFTRITGFVHGNFEYVPGGEMTYQEMADQRKIKTQLWLWWDSNANGEADVNDGYVDEVYGWTEMYWRKVFEKTTGDTNPDNPGEVYHSIGFMINFADQATWHIGTDEGNDIDGEATFRPAWDDLLQGAIVQLPWDSTHYTRPVSYLMLIRVVWDDPLTGLQPTGDLGAPIGPEYWWDGNVLDPMNSEGDPINGTPYMTKEGNIAGITSHEVVWFRVNESPAVGAPLPLISMLLYGNLVLGCVYAVSRKELA